MNSILMPIVAVLCLIKGCVCPRSYRDSPSVPRSDPFTASTDPKTWGIYEPTVKELLAPPRPLLIDQPQPFYTKRILQSKPSISLQPKNPVAPQPFYDQRLMRAKSNLQYSQKSTEQPNPKYENFPKVDREWFDRQDFTNDPLITAPGDFMVEIVRSRFKYHVIVIELSDYQDLDVQKYLQWLVKDIFKELIVVRAFFGLCPETKIYYNVGIYSPTFIILSNGEWLHRSTNLMDLHKNLIGVYNFRTQPTSSIPRLPRSRSNEMSWPPLQPSDYEIAENPDEEWWWTKKDDQQLSDLPSTSGPQRQMVRQMKLQPMVARQENYIQMARGDNHFNLLLQNAGPVCVLVEITDDDRTEKYIQQFLTHVKIRFQNAITIIKVNKTTCKNTALFYKVRLVLPVFIIIPRNRSHKVFRFSSEYGDVRARIENKISEICID